MHSLEITIKILSPVVLTSTSNATVMTGTHLAFSDSIIRGVLASRFRREQKLTDEAHNKTFRKIFFGGLKFLPANTENYNYEAIDAGQTFRGEIIGDEQILREMRDGLNLNDDIMTSYVGRSKFTQYGECLMTFGAIKKLSAPQFGDKIFLLLDTPLIPADDCFLSAKEILRTEIADKLSGNIGKVFAAGIEIENFVEPWQMKRPQVTALAAGTVFELQLPALTDNAKKFCTKNFSTASECARKKVLVKCELGRQILLAQARDELALRKNISTPSKIT